MHRSLRPPILSVFGDIGLAIGPEFKKYLQFVIAMLDQATKAQVDHTNPDLVEYLGELRDGCLEAYTGIIQGIKSDSGVHFGIDFAPLHAHVPQVFLFIESIFIDQEHTDSNLTNALGLVGYDPFLFFLLFFAPKVALLDLEHSEVHLIIFYLFINTI